MHHTLAFLALLGCSSVAAAQSHQGDNTRWRFDAAGHASFFLGGDQRKELGFDNGFGATLKAGYRVSGPMVVELGYDVGLFLSKEGHGAIHSAISGVRLEFPIGAMVLGPYAHVGVGVTGENIVARFDVGAEAMVYASRNVGVGVALTYNQVLWPDEVQYTSDARYLNVGIVLRFVPGRMATKDSEASKRSVRPPQATYRREKLPPALPEDPMEQAEVMKLLDDALPTKTTEHRLIPAVVFEFDSDKMLPCGEVALYAAVDRILASEGPVDIEGHADAAGSDEHNQQLSTRRAQVVKAWLIKQGIPADRLRSKSYGESVHLTKDATNELNRRVTFKVRTASGSESSTLEGAPSCSVGAPL